MKENRKMPRDELAAYIEKFLKSQNMIVLATSKGDIPRATPMDYYSDKFNIYVYPGAGKKLENLSVNQVLSATIFAPFVNDTVKAIQITTTNLNFIKVGDAEYKNAEKIYRWKGKECYLKIIPEKIELLDFSLKDMGLDIRQELVL